MLNINEIPIVNLSISGPKELQEILLLVRFEIAHFVNILVGTRLDFAGHVLFPQNMSLLLMSIFGFSLCGQFLNQFLVVLLSLSFFFQDCFLLVHTFDHFHANRDLLLIILARSWNLIGLLAVIWESSFVVSY